MSCLGLLECFAIDNNNMTLLLFRQVPQTFILRLRHFQVRLDSKMLVARSLLSPVAFTGEVGGDQGDAHAHAHVHMHTHTHVNDGVPAVAGCVHQGSRDAKSESTFSSPCQVVPPHVTGSFDDGFPSVTGRIRQGYRES